MTSGFSQPVLAPACRGPRETWVGMVGVRLKPQPLGLYGPVGAPQAHRKPLSNNFILEGPLWCAYGAPADISLELVFLLDPRHGTGSLGPRLRLPAARHQGEVVSAEPDHDFIDLGPQLARDQQPVLDCATPARTLISTSTLIELIDMGQPGGEVPVAPAIEDLKPLVLDWTQVHHGLDDMLADVAVRTPSSFVRPDLAALQDIRHDMELSPIPQCRPDLGHQVIHSLLHLLLVDPPVQPHPDLMARQVRGIQFKMIPRGV